MLILWGSSSSSFVIGCSIDLNFAFSVLVLNCRSEGFPERDIWFLGTLDQGSARCPELLGRRRRRRRRHLETQADILPGNYNWRFSYGLGLLVRDLGEWRPGFYTEFRCASHEHSGLPWGAFFGKNAANQEIHTFWKWGCSKMRYGDFYFAQLHFWVSNFWWFWNLPYSYDLENILKWVPGLDLLLDVEIWVYMFIFSHFEVQNSVLRSKI